MAAYRFVTLTCDGCGEVWDHGYVTRIPVARKKAREGEGWVAPGNNVDLCPRCAPPRAQP